MVTFFLIPQREKQELETLDPFWTPLFVSGWWWCGIQPFSPVRFFVTPWTVACQALLSMGFPRQECWLGCHLLPQGTLLTQGLNLCLAAPALAGGFFTTTTTWGAHTFWRLQYAQILALSLQYCPCWGIFYLHRLFQYPPNCFPCFLPELLQSIFSNTATMIPLEPESKPVLCSNRCVPSCSE